MKKGDRVLIKTSGDEPGARRVWEPDEGRPYVCLEDYWTRWKRHGINPVCPSISSAQVFVFDEALYNDLMQAFRGSRQGDEDAQQRLVGLWEQAKCY